MYKKVKNNETIKSNGNLKIILCFSGFVSLLALAVPTSFKPAMSEEEQYQKMLEDEQLIASEDLAQAEEEAKLEAKAEEQLKREKSSNIVVQDNSYDDFKFGEPSFDPNPAGLGGLYPNNPSPQLQNNQGFNTNTDFDDDDYYEE